MRLLRRRKSSRHRDTETQGKAESSVRISIPLHLCGRPHQLREIHDDEAGQATIEYMLILLGFIIPLIYFLNLLLDVLIVHYRTVTFLETLPFP